MNYDWFKGVRDVAAESGAIVRKQPMGSPSRRASTIGLLHRAVSFPLLGQQA